MKQSLVSHIIYEATALFITAVCLGLAYNSTTPLGVRLNEPSVAAASTSTSTPPPIAGPTGYTNATVAVTVPTTPDAALLSPAVPPAPGPAALVPTGLPTLPAGLMDGALHNETITASIISTGGNPPATVQKLLVAMPWADVKPLLERGEIILVDGRDSLSYEAGHIPGAVSLPMKMINEKIGDFMAKYPKTKPLVVYCASIQCPISHAEALLLGDQFGYADVREMPGGYAEWMVAESKATASTGGKP